MDSQRTPRAPEDPGRGSPMVKQNPPLGFRGPPPLSPRYPINNSSSGGPRGQQILHRAEVRSGGPFVQPRSPFGGSAQGNQRPGNPTIPQGVPRYPPGVRPPPPSNFVLGPRPQVLNQPQQIYYQPRNGETRPASLEHSTPQIRFPSFPQNPDIRQRHNIPETVVTSARNDWPLRADVRVNGQSVVPIVRAQATIRQKAEKMEEKMDTVSQRGTNIEDNVKPSPRAEDDDDDVVMDKENNSKSPDPKERPPSVRVPDSPGSRTSSYKSTPEHTASLVRGDPRTRTNSAKKSPSPEPIVKSAKLNDQEIGNSEIKSSPTPTMEDRLVSEIKSSPTPVMEDLPVSEMKSSPTPITEDLPVSDIKSSPTPIMEDLPVSEVKSSPTPTMEDLPVSESHDEPSKLSSASSDKGVASRTESRIGESKSPDHSINDDSNDFEENETILRAREEETRNDPRTPDNSTTLSIPLTSSPDRASPKSPLGSVKGFDNGQPRSLSPMSPTPRDPVSPNSIPKSAGAAGKKTASPDETEIEQEKEESKTGLATPRVQARDKSANKVAERAPGTPDDSIKRSTSGRSIKSDAAIESGINHAATPTTNGVALSPTKKLPSKSRETDKRTGSPVKSPSKSIKSLPRTPEAGPPSTAEKKIPMNKVQVGAAPSPNLKTVRSKIGSLDNASYKPGGGKVKIENRKLDFSKAQPKIAAKNDKYTPSGGDKKITQVKLQWNAKPKVGSLDNATYKPGGGDKKIETVKLDFKDKAKPKVGSKDNAKHVPGGGTVKSSSTPPKTPQDPPNDIETQKIDIKAESKIGSLDNVKHKPGGGDKKIFNDKDYLRQTGSNVESLNGSGAQIESPTVAERFIESSPPDPPPSSPTRRSSPISPLTPRALQSPSTVKRVTIAEESIKESGGSKIPDGRERPRSSESRKGLRLPELISARSPDNQAVKVESKMKLPKLIETSALSSRVQL